MVAAMGIELKLNEALDCIADFTYNFLWQHGGTKLKPDARIPAQVGTSYTYEEIVEALRSGEDVHIRGDVGSRLGSSLGVDLCYFGGNGKEISETGTIIVDGNAGSYMGMSMVSGAIYVRGEVKEPLGNVVQVESEREGYKKFVSITWLLHHPHQGRDELHAGDILEPNEYRGDNELILKDGVLRSTIGARCDAPGGGKIRVKGDTGISAGILMRRGTLIVEGNAGMNTGALLNGGTVVILGDAAEFTGVEMRSGVVLVKGECKGYIGAKMTGGRIICRMSKRSGGPGAGHIPPVKERALSREDINLLSHFGISGVFAMNYRKYEV